MMTDKKELSDEGIETILDYWKSTFADPQTLDKKKAYYYIGLMLEHIEILIERNSQETENDNTRKALTGCSEQMQDQRSSPTEDHICVE